MSAAEKLESNSQVESNQPTTEREMLRMCFLFRDASEDALNFIVSKLEPVFFAKGDPIILQGENNDHVYFVKSGSVEIVNYLPDEKRVQRLALLKAGSHFAEFSVLTKAQKVGSAYAYEDSELYRVNGPDFLEMLHRFPDLPSNLVKELAEFNFKMEASNDFIPLFTPSQFKGVGGLADILPVDSWNALGSIPLEYKAGVLSLAMLDPRSNTFFEALDKGSENLEVMAYAIDQNQFNGILNLAISGKSKGPAPIIEDSAKTWNEDSVVASLRQASVFKDFPEEILTQLKDYLPIQEFKAGSLISSPGDTADKIFVILTGQVLIARSIEGAKAKAAIQKLGPGQLIHEVSLIHHSPTVHFIRTLEDTKVLMLPTDVIQQLMSTPVFTVPLAIYLARRMGALGQTSGQKYYKPDHTPDFSEVRRLLPYSVMAEHLIMPLELKDNEVLLGVVNSDTSSVMGIANRYLSEYRVRLVHITNKQYEDWFLEFASAAKKDAQNSSVIPQSATAVKGSAGVSGAKVQLADVSNLQVDPVHILNEILLRGLNNRASDIHFEPFEKGMTIRYRVDGVMIESQDKITAAIGKQLTSRLKILATMDIANHNTPQDGQLKTDIKGVAFVARASSLPVKYGEKIVLRIIRQRNSIIPLNVMVPDRRSILALQSVAKSAHGLFLVTGPTGSGKTTTLYSLLSEINKVDVNVITIEDPVEMEIAGCNQVEIDKKKGLDFAAALRSCLRQDPDVIMVGEIRDQESAQIVFDAAITGHLVLSTLHTDSSLDVIPRLSEFDIPPATIAAGLLGVLTQRLVRAVCKKCKATKPITEGEKKYIHSILPTAQIPETLSYGRGCNACNGSGYLDRVPVFEIWRNTSEMSSAILSGASLLELEKVARKDGYVTIFEFGVKMALIGLTTLEEVRNNLSSVHSQH